MNIKEIFLLDEEAVAASFNGTFSSRMGTDFTLL